MNSISKDKRTYYHCGIFAYLVGLLTTMFVMVVFKHAQPALLYLVPTCVGFPLALAWFKGELAAMLKYVIVSYIHQIIVKTYVFFSLSSSYLLIFLFIELECVLIILTVKYYIRFYNRIFFNLRYYSYKVNFLLK